jgi:hypothetical protein
LTRAKTARKFPNAPYWVMLRDAEKKILTWAIEQAKNSRDVGRLLGVPPSFCARRARVHGLKMSALPGTPPTIERAADNPDPWPPPSAVVPTEEEPHAVVQPPCDPIS